MMTATAPATWYNFIESYMMKKWADAAEINLDLLEELIATNSSRNVHASPGRLCMYYVYDYFA